MVKLYAPTLLLLLGAMGSQAIISAERPNAATSRDVSSAGAVPASKPAARSALGGAFDYECDDACLIPGAPVPAGKYAVVSPVGRQTVQMIKQAPRLDTLGDQTAGQLG